MKFSLVYMGMRSSGPRGMLRCHTHTPPIKMCIFSVLLISELSFLSYTFLFINVYTTDAVVVLGACSNKIVNRSGSI